MLTIDKTLVAVTVEEGGVTATYDMDIKEDGVSLKHTHHEDRYARYVNDVQLADGKALFYGGFQEGTIVEISLDGTGYLYTVPDGGVQQNVVAEELGILTGREYMMDFIERDGTYGAALFFQDDDENLMPISRAEIKSKPAFSLPADVAAFVETGIK